MLFCLILLSCLYSCSRLEIKELLVNSIVGQEALLLKDVKKDFNNDLNYNKSSQKYSTNVLFKNFTQQKLIPIWEFSTQISNHNNIAFETPLIKTQKKVRIYNFQERPLTPEEQSSIFKKSIIRLLSIKRHNKFENIILTYTPSINYKKPFKDITLNNLKDFTGYIEYQNVSEEVLFVAKFINGKLYKKYPIIKSSKQLSQTKIINSSGTIKSSAKIASTNYGENQECGWVEEEVPIYGTLCITLGDPPIESCGEEIVGSEIQLIYVECDEGGGSEGFCDLPENYYICFEQGIGGGGDPGIPPTNYDGLSAAEIDLLNQLQALYRGRMTPSEREIFDNMSAINRLAYLRNAFAAEEYVKNNFVDGFYNGKADAFRHAYFVAMNTDKIGYNLAKALSDAHENVTQHPLEITMDLHNNSIGLLYNGNLNPGLDPRNYVINAFNSGSLLYISPTDANGGILPNSTLKITTQ